MKYFFKILILGIIISQSASTDQSFLKQVNIFRDKPQSSTQFVLTKLTAQYMWPVEGEITSWYGYRIHPITEEIRFHRGIDIAAAEGTPVFAAADGIIEYAAFSDCYGKLIDIRHSDGSVTRYAHLNGFNVWVGQEVTKGQAVGSLGSTGCSTGPHLHFEVLINGTTDDPMNYLPTLTASAATN